MATIILSSCPGYKEQGPGYVSMCCEPFGEVGPRERTEAASISAIRQAVAAYGKRVTAAHPGISFLVSVSVARGSRKPNGFDASNRHNGLGQENWMELRDVDGKPVPAAPPPASDAASPASIALV